MNSAWVQGQSTEVSSHCSCATILPQVKDTPLHHAAINEHVEIVKVLLKAGADTETIDEVSQGVEEGWR